MSLEEFYFQFYNSIWQQFVIKQTKLDRARIVINCYEDGVLPLLLVFDFEGRKSHPSFINL